VGTVVHCGRFRVQGRIGLEQEDVRLFVGDRQCSTPCGMMDELARLDSELLVSELHPQPAFHHEEQLVFMLGMVPDRTHL